MVKVEVVHRSEQKKRLRHTEAHRNRVARTYRRRQKNTLSLVQADTSRQEHTRSRARTHARTSEHTHTHTHTCP